MYFHERWNWALGLKTLPQNRIGWSNFRKRWLDNSLFWSQAILWKSASCLIPTSEVRVCILINLKLKSVPNSPLKSPLQLAPENAGNRVTPSVFTSFRRSTYRSRFPPVFQKFETERRGKVPHLKVTTERRRNVLQAGFK